MLKFSLLLDLYSLMMEFARKLQQRLEQILQATQPSILFPMNIISLTVFKTIEKIGTRENTSAIKGSIFRIQP